MGKTNKHLKSGHFQVQNKPCEAQHKKKIERGIVWYPPVLDGFKDPVVLGFLLILITLMSLNFVSASEWNAELNQGLIAYWNFTNVAEDNTGNGHTGYLNGTSQETGKIGNSRGFDGTSGILVPNNAFDFGSSEFTINFWEYAYDQNGRAVMGTINPSNKGWAFSFSDPTGNMTWVQDGSVVVMTPEKPIVNAWQMITIRRNSTKISIWVNGTEINSADDSDASAGFVNFTMGRIPAPVASYNGRLDEVGIWNRSLTETEVLQLFNDSYGITNQQYNTYAILNSPADKGSYYSQNIVFNSSSYSIANLKNTTLYINGISNETKAITGTATTTTFVKNLTIGESNWSVKSCDINNLCYHSINRTITALSFTENYQNYTTSTIENSLETFKISISYPSTLYSSVFAKLYYNNTIYDGIQTGTGDSVVFTTSLTTPLVSSGINISFYWTIGLSDAFGTYYYNSTIYNQTVNNYAVDDCSVYTNLLFNFTLNDEDNLSLINGTLENSTIKVDFTIKSPDGSLLSTSSIGYSSVNHAPICSNINLTASSYRWDSVVKYYTDLRAEEYYYLQNYSLNLNTDNQTIALYSLLLTDSTSFIVTYTENNQVMKGGIVTALRYYVESGTYLEIENGKTDDNGETILHLIEEDVIYKFKVAKEGKFLYLSEDYRVLCSLITGDCRIELTKERVVTPFPEDWTNFAGGSYILRSYPNERMVSLIFSLNYPATMNLTVYKYSWNETIMSQIIEQKTTTGQYGYINISIPYSYGNSTYYAVLYKDNQFITSVWLNIKEDIRQYVGVWINVLIGIMVLTMALITISSGVGIIIFTLLGLIIAMALQILDMRYAVFSFILLAGILLLIKILMRKGD